MRLSETKQSKTQRHTLATPGERHQRSARFWKLTGSVGVLVLLVAATIGAVSLGRQLVTHAAEAANNCTLIVPNQPLTAQGLATPYQLAGGCHEANADQAAFVQAAVLDPATGQVSIYNPLVIDRGTQPAAQPVMPQLPQNAVVGIWFGFNGDTLTLQGGKGGNCVNGLGNSPFGQFAYCNAPQFFAAANNAIKAGKLTPPPLGTAQDGMPCPSTRDFFVVDQDQSDNLTTSYLITQDGRVAQNTAANQAALPGATVQTNGSDEGLLATAIDKALGCTPWMAPDLADPGQMVPALPLNEMQAAAHQQAPAALVPEGDPMVLVNDKPNRAKLNLYRVGVDQPPAGPGRFQASTTQYCQNMLQIAPARMQQDMDLLMAQPSPAADAANNLFKRTGKQSPITLQQDDNGVTIGATINLNGQGDGNGGNGTGQANAPTCVINGKTIQGCMGQAMVNDQPCSVMFDAANQQVTITCQKRG